MEPLLNNLHKYFHLPANNLDNKSLVSRTHQKLILLPGEIQYLLMLHKRWRYFMLQFAENCGTKYIQYCGGEMEQGKVSEKIFIFYSIFRTFLVMKNFWRKKSSFWTHPATLHENFHNFFFSKPSFSEGGIDEINCEWGLDNIWNIVWNIEREYSDR